MDCFMATAKKTQTLILAYVMESPMVAFMQCPSPLSKRSLTLVKCGPGRPRKKPQSEDLEKQWKRRLRGSIN